MPALTAHRHHLCQRSSGWRESAVHLPPTGNLTRLLGCQPSSSEFVPHLYALRTISEIAYAARGHCSRRGYGGSAPEGTPEVIACRLTFASSCIATICD